MVSGFEYEYKFTDTNCQLVEFELFQWTNVLTYINATYFVFIVIVGYLYGRHEGISCIRNEERILIPSLNSTSSKVRRSLSNIWFIISIFIYPWYLCCIWLFYGIVFDINYINKYNPWILSVVLLYISYSVMVLISFSFYSDKSRFSKLSNSAQYLFTGIVTLLMLYLVIKNKRNRKTSSFEFTSLFGNNLRYCLSGNGTINSILFIISSYILHHIFILIRCITAKSCNYSYLSLPPSFIRKNRNHLSRKSYYSHRGGHGDAYDESIIDCTTTTDNDDDNDYISNNYHDTDDDEEKQQPIDPYNINFEDIVIRNRSGSRFGSASIAPSMATRISHQSIEYDNEPIIQMHNFRNNINPSPSPPPMSFAPIKPVPPIPPI